MHRFFIETEGPDSVRALLSKEEAAHALRVLRLKDGEKVEALDGKGGIWSGVIRIDGENVFVEIGDALNDCEAGVNVTIYMGIPKGEKLEFIAQKLTELGASTLVPVRMERCIAKIDDKEQEKKLSRIRKIAKEAQKQCGRARELTILPPVDFKKAVTMIAKHDVTALLWEEADGYRLKDAWQEFSDAEDVAYIVGPEGGISQREAEAFIEAGAKCVSLGPRILRAETAAVTGCAVIMSLWGDI